MEIKILGPGCARSAVRPKNWSWMCWRKPGRSANVEKVTDLMKIAEYGVFGTPAVVVDGQVKCVGKIPKKEDVKTWISK